MFELPPFVVRARLVRPRLPRVLRRPRLLDLLADAVPRHRLTVVCAGPGYGKTTLLAELADQLRGDVLWYSLSPEDGDLTTFLWHLAALFRRVSPRAGRSVRGLLREGPLGARSEVAAGAALLNDLGALHDPAHIVLDDFHHVAAQPALVSVLGSVIENLKGPVTFVLASRAVPPLPLPRWRARRQIFELGPRDLAFTHDELRDLLHDIHGRSVPEEDLARLMVSTDGWITPVQMALQAEEGAGSGSLPASLQQAGLTGGILHDYLAEEILDRQTADDRQWLLRTAGFENLEPPFLSAVFQDPAVEDRLQSLARRGLVLAYAEGGARLYRYHVLFREFLQRRAAVELPVPERDRVHQRAAELLHQQGDIIGAAQQLARMSRPDPLAALLVEQGLALLDRGQYQALVSLVESLPPEMVAGDPWLLLRLADGRHYLGQWPAAELQHEQAARIFHERGDAAGEAWALLGLARLANLRGEAERAAELCSTIGELLSRVSGEDEEILRPRLLQVHSGALYYQGRYAGALALLEQLDGLTRGESGRRAALWNNRAVVAASQGDYPAAVRAFERGLEMPGARVSPRAPLHMTNLALLYCETGDAERARTLFDEALNRARSFENKSQIVSALLGQAHLDYSLGQHDQCLERLKLVAEAGTELKVPLIEADRLALKAEILAGFGQYPAARELLEQAIQTYGPARQDANALSFRIQRAVLELRGGRAAEAWSQLQELRTEAGSLEDLAPRARLLLHLGEAAFELGRDDAESDLDEALSLAGRFGHHTYFRLAIQRNVKPFIGLLRQGRRTDVLVRILSSIGPEMEPPILPLLSEPLETAAWQAVVAILGSAGGMESHARLQQELAAAPASRRRAVESALRRIEARHAVPCPIESVSRRGLELTTLGRIRLTGPLGEIPVDSWKSRRALMIFIYLASRRGRGAPKDRLIELFWPGVSLRRAEKNFHPTLSYARRALRPHIQGPVFVSAGGLYQIAPSLALELDVVRFEQIAAELGRRTAARSPSPLLEEALRLYQGDFLEGWDDPWLEETRARLRSRYERILSEGADLLVKEGRHDRAAECLRKLIDCSPYDEDAHLRLMRCYTQLRDRNQVRVVYETLRRRLRTDLQVEPLPETRRGCEALLEK